MGTDGGTAAPWGHAAAGFRQEWADLFPALAQSPLETPGRFLRFAQRCGVAAHMGDVELLLDRGWLVPDGEYEDGTPVFHPFRVYPFYWVLKVCDLNIAPSATIRRDTLPHFLATVVDECLPSLESIDAMAADLNGIIELPLVLEPLYWPEVAGVVRVPGFPDEAALLDEYRAAVRNLVAGLDPSIWEEDHRRLRYDAASIDDNHELYVLLRLASWERRQRLRGRVAAALWVRHIAEVLRRAFEDVHRVRWDEEDHARFQWMRGARLRTYGSERPLDAAAATEAYVAFNFGLRRGSVLRWYVEGDTELGAIAECLPDAATLGIELANLKGSPGKKQRMPMKLPESLQQDRELRRFSAISFDMDQRDLVRQVRTQVRQGRVVGFLSPSDPDFEFANFSLRELVEVAARLDEKDGRSGEQLRLADWLGVRSGRAFQDRYGQISESGRRQLKSERWGRALARYAFDHPDTEAGLPRPFLEAIDQAVRCRRVHYDHHAAVLQIDPDTFELVRRPDPPEHWKP